MANLSNRLADATVQPFICGRCLSRLHAASIRRSSKRWQSTTKLGSPRPGALTLLEKRGYIKEIAGDRDHLSKILDTRKVGFYSGIDPTAPSLHLGHLLPLMVLIWLYHHGHNVLSLIGGATARVGDPSGRLTTRIGMSETTQLDNVTSMSAQISKLWGNATEIGKKHGYGLDGSGSKTLLNNSKWLDKLNILDFLKMAGNSARVGTMLGRDTVKNKMEKGDGMSFAEFTYPLLQAWDWWHMYQNHDIQIQVGGSDQYGNIVAGIDTVRYIAQSNHIATIGASRLDAQGKIKDDNQPMGLTVPLLTTSSGDKFGKSAGNAIWLDQSMTSSFDLYGFLLRSADDDVERYLNLFTLLPQERISEVMSQQRQDPGRRIAQHLLASEVVELAHGAETAATTRSEHQQLRAPSLDFLLSQQQKSGTIDKSVEESTRGRMKLRKAEAVGQQFSQVLLLAGLAKTRSNGKRMIEAGGVYVAKRSDTPQEGEAKLDFVALESDKTEKVEDYIMDGLLVLRLGKWKVSVIELVSDGDE